MTTTGVLLTRQRYHMAPHTRKCLPCLRLMVSMHHSAKIHVPVRDSGESLGDSNGSPDEFATIGKARHIV